MTRWYLSKIHVCFSCLNESDPSNCTRLQENKLVAAAKSGNINAARVCLEQGIDVNFCKVVAAFERRHLSPALLSVHRTTYIRSRDGAQP